MSSNYSSSSVPPKPAMSFKKNRSGANSDSRNKFYANNMNNNNISNNKNNSNNKSIKKENKLLIKKASDRKIYEN